MVEGASHHEVAIDVALGRRPDFPRHAGAFSHAAKFMPRTYSDARVERAPDDATMTRLKQRFPEALLSVHVHEGMRLCDLPNQDSYSFELADLFLGGESRADLQQRFGEAMEILDFRFSGEVETNFERQEVSRETEQETR